nr:pitrilysin family protein [Luteimonas galliterrae]
MLDHGTMKRDKYAIAELLEDVGASVTFNVDGQTLGIQAKSLKKDLPVVISLIAEQLRAPAFSPVEFELVRKQFIGAMKGQVENVGYRTSEAFSRAVFPVGHPNRSPSLEELIAAAQSVTMAEVKAFHRQHYGPLHMTLVVVGDVDAIQVKREVARGFKGWQGGVDYLVATDAPAPLSAGEEAVRLAEKTSVSILLGQPTGLRYRDTDALALRVGTAILGSGFTGRLMATIRDKEGMTYGINARMSDDTFNDGSWTISATFAPQMLEDGVESARRELLRWWSAGVTQKELDDRKQNLIGSFQVGLATTRGIADTLLQTVLRGYDIGWLDRYPEAVAALTREQVNAAIREHLDPHKMILVKAGTLPEKALMPAE